MHGFLHWSWPLVEAWYGSTFTDRPSPTLGIVSLTDTPGRPDLAGESSGLGELHFNAGVLASPPPLATATVVRLPARLHWEGSLTPLQTGLLPLLQVCACPCVCVCVCTWF